MLRINDIIDKAQTYLPPEDLEMIEKAYIYSASVHQGQVRLSGEPYLTHPMEVAGILTDMKMDAATIISGLLHDTIEDTLTTAEQLEREFGKDVAFLVEGLTKRLGINSMRMELEDLSFQYIAPDAYEELSAQIAKSNEARNRYTEEVK